MPAAITTSDGTLRHIWFNCRLTSLTRMVNMSDCAMSDSASIRRSHIVGAAMPVFLRYGFGRTTMADIVRPQA
jgi:hypothetical protein